MLHSRRQESPARAPQPELNRTLNKSRASALLYNACWTDQTFAVQEQKIDMNRINLSVLDEVSTGQDTPGTCEGAIGPLKKERKTNNLMLT